MTSVLSNSNVNTEIFSYSSSDDLLTKPELDSYLDELGIFSKPLNQFFGRAIEEIDTKITGKK